MLEKVFAGLGLFACALVWLGLAMGPARRRRLRDWPGEVWRRLRGTRQARREAADVIERVRRRPPADRDGNVIRPKSFGSRPDGKDKLH